MLPGTVQAAAGPALPHVYGARSGGAEELHHQRQVSHKLGCRSTATVRAVSQRLLLYRCVLASLLTVALHNKLSYLTDVMEVLLMDLMQQNSNAQPKLLLRRTEFTVEKLLTNWMSICLYGFLRVCHCPTGAGRYPPLVKPAWFSG